MGPAGGALRVPARPEGPINLSVQIVAKLVLIHRRSLRDSVSTCIRSSTGFVTCTAGTP